MSSLNDLIPKELRSDFAYKVDDFSEELEIHNISSVSQVEYYGKQVLCITLGDDARIIPLNTPSKLKQIIGILGDDVPRWRGKNIGIRVKAFYDRDNDKHVRYLTFDLPQETLPTMSARDYMTNLEYSTVDNDYGGDDIIVEAQEVDDDDDKVKPLIDTPINKLDFSDDDIPFTLLISFIGLAYLLLLNNTVWS